ncbi:MAG: sugar phosphate isomerase/epimerase [SAR324 cluster bacterium]|nr:sugar phosphate isomerase/epimerase [SAR324 cluster bacterium]
MKFGMNLLLWTVNLPEEIMPVVKNLKEMGFDGVEVPIFDLTPEKWTAAGRRLDDLGLERTAVTVRGEEDNPISSDPKIRANAVEQTKLTLECTQAMGSSLLVGPLYAALGVFSGAGPTEDEWKWGVESMRQMAEHAEKCGVTLALEFLNRFEIYLLNCAADTKRFVQEVDHPNCRMMYDTFHANIEEKSFADSIRDCKDTNVHVHISENDRSIPGSGNIDWEEIFDAFLENEYDGWMTIEAFGMALAELIAATKIWRRMYGTEEQLARDGLAFMKNEIAKRTK